MKLTITQENLSRALSAVGRVASAKAGLPVLGNILLRTESSRLLVAATNLEIASTSFVGVKVDTPGEITIPARLLQEYVANLPKAPVELELSGSELTIKCQGFSSTMRGIDAKEFPELPTIDEAKAVHYQLQIGEFKQAIAQTLFACSKDATRPVLTGVYWHSFEGKLYLAATDGYRLAERRLVDTTSEIAAIIPSSTLQEVVRIIHDDDEAVDVLFDESQVRLRVGQTEITSRLIDGKYPDYRQLIPKITDVAAAVSVQDLVRTAKIAGLFARETGGSIIIRADDEQNSFTIESVATELGENASTLSTDVSGSGTVSLNSRYLAEVLSVIDSDQVSIGFSGKLAPILLRPADGETDANYTHIIMPLKS
ncbi:DNA polymerase III subunit beta [Candidatus Saccharibacteria bacterium]|nr:MAG: DNA polymerase III subunit beta [Candidatus Saccharibacteria bacterium]